MTLKTGRKCTWEEIEVGEVFAWAGCWQIVLKISEKDAVSVASTREMGIYFEKFSDNEGGKNISISNYFKYLGNSGEYLYKLPKSVQALWKEE